MHTAEVTSKKALRVTGVALKWQRLESSGPTLSFYILDAGQHDIS